MNQYQTELKAVEDRDGDIDEFKSEWFKRACAAYRKIGKTKEEINNFRRGNVNI